MTVSRGFVFPPPPPPLFLKNQIRGNSKRRKRRFGRGLETKTRLDDAINTPLISICFSFTNLADIDYVTLTMPLYHHRRSSSPIYYAYEQQNHRLAFIQLKGKSLEKLNSNSFSIFSDSYSYSNVRFDRVVI